MLARSNRHFEERKRTRCANEASADIVVQLVHVSDLLSGFVRRCEGSAHITRVLVVVDDFLMVSPPLRLRLREVKHGSSDTARHDGSRKRGRSDGRGCSKSVSHHFGVIYCGRW